MTLSLPVQYAITIIVGSSAIFLGKYIEKQATLNMTRYRDKSALYGRELKPGEPPSWP